MEVLLKFKDFISFKLALAKLLISDKLFSLPKFKCLNLEKLIFSKILTENRSLLLYNSNISKLFKFNLIKGDKLLI